jgi:hypothetical protein
MGYSINGVVATGYEIQISNRKNTEKYPTCEMRKT